MPEGPSIVLLREAAQRFVGRRVLDVAGNSKQPIARLQHRVLKQVRSWGKHFLLDFGPFWVRIHFGLFGSWRIDEATERAPRLRLQFSRGETLAFYACSVRIVDGDVEAHYDWSVDVMDPRWDAKAARAKLRRHPDALVADALLDQDVFSGVGNIIKNEVLHRIRVHPESRVGALPSRKLAEMVEQARVYSFDFLAWKRDFVLRQHWQVHAKTICPRDGTRLSYRKHLGKRQRRAFWCATCQRLYK
ncbi:DNA-formamidopyrimidine glycosylase family protein [Solilutibacter silvestris]|uniref:Formamidopyrimidine-DNA glycosylase H2TH domain n=1 Tax=Solilutibacter silvestris TaxID=1645665 RepID=A0A2K1Q0N3_9GAMM|nr:DNA-formamidopyrimidine glycosylase family protein [Lysobacter silvestris]PNS08601.1 Formamidopyrimidine-DNA glycosylase H2TH domain [Lysobacter silvestris]